MLQTALHDWHASHGGRMVDFAGWHMPIQYTSIVEEHHAVRQHAGLFDISHMGRVWFSGPGATEFLNLILTNDVSKMHPGQIRYSLVCREDGGILDDVLIYRFAEKYLLVVNGANREKILGWIEKHRAGYDVQIEDSTLATTMIAIQGPQAEELLQPFVEAELGQIKYYYGVETRAFGVPAVISRTGYTGEDGFELSVDNASGVAAWEQLIQAGVAIGLVPCGLGCRDTLRLEAAMPLYGHEMDESVNPLTSGLAFGVKLDKSNFIGKEALAAVATQPDLPKRIGLKLSGKRIARQGAEIYSGDLKLGDITSGTFSPTLQESLAMGYVPASHATPGKEVEIDIRGKRETATVVALPFYKRAKK
ncbi:glycine cleavage system aminomethyltransferase GcvT [Planctomicrobium sp. SH668]|uniref:glycine cleavage system aminomethyltransferase GcvT n=1 Tax=Planctomicrobium sp. SH668 TaxID=3448126 RepID=UPI003F5AEA2C